jgi:K+-transporting ATPase ATPase A chain
MFVLFTAGFTTVYWAESHPHLLIHGAAQTGTATAPAGNMEGKEVRFGVSQSSLFSTITTDASCGAVNTMHDSLTLPNCSREDRIRDGPFKCRG